MVANLRVAVPDVAFAETLVLGQPCGAPVEVVRVVGDGAESRGLLRVAGR